MLIDESTSISNKSVLALYVRTAFYDINTNKTDAAYAFPLGLIQLDSLTADHITQKVLSYLNKNGFTHEYLVSNLISVCADGASTMIGKKTGVLTLIKEAYPNILLWHCMCHRIELAVGDAVKSTVVLHDVTIIERQSYYCLSL